MATLSTSSNYGKAHVDAHIVSRLLEIGNLRNKFREYAKKEKLPQGEGTVIRFLRYDRLDVPLTTLSEGVPPADDSPTLNYIEATAGQYGQVVTLTDVLQMTVKHPVLQQAIKLVADSMVRTDDRIIQDALIAGTNVFYGGNRASRDLLQTTDVLTTTILKRVHAALDLTDGVAGGAPYFEGGMWGGCLHKKLDLDLGDDQTWKDMAVRQDKEKLKRGVVNVWQGSEWKTSNFMHELENVGATETLVTNGGTITGNTGTGSSFVAAQTVLVRVTRTHKKRGFEEKISQLFTRAITTTGNNLIVTIGTGGTSANFVYNISISESDGSSTVRRAATRVAAGSVSTFTNFQAAGTIAPIQPGVVGVGGVTAGFKAYIGYVFGDDAFGVVDLDGAKLDAGVTKSERSIADPLMQIRKVGAKFFMTALILNDLWIARVECASAY
jgi:N4-gp56 family major capsid protein